jgi:hypothetical protein
MISNDSEPRHPLAPVGHGEVDLSEIAAAPGPFATLFLSRGDAALSRARLAIDGIPVPAPHSGALIDTVPSSLATSQVTIADGDGNVNVIGIDDPFTADVARFGQAPSLGPILEVRQMVAPHTVVTIEDDVYAVTDFGSESRASDQHLVFEARDLLAEHLRSSRSRMMALIGTEDAIESEIDQLRNGLAAVRFVTYPTNDIDGDLASLADQVVRDAASLAAELRTHELAHFRQARIAGQAVEGAAVLTALEDGTAQRVLVHDAIEVDFGSSNRIADLVIATAIRTGVPVTMIPDVPADRGPREGIGAILEGDGTAVGWSEQPMQTLSEARPVA